MGRRTKWVAGVLAVLVAAAIATMAWPRSPYPCRATFEQVKVGMTRAEVEDAVGGPPGDYSGGRAVGRIAWADGWSPDPGAVTWLAADAELMVWFGPDGTATNADTHGVMQLPGFTLLNRLRARLGL